jgi:hypothetical protein
LDVGDAVEVADDDLFGSLMDRFGEIGGVDLDIPLRRTTVRGADLAD